MADENIISSSKREIYSKLLTIANKYVDAENSDFLKTGFFGSFLESMAMMMRDSTFHKSMIYNESFLNTAVIPKSVYNWAKMFNIAVQSATPGYADIEILIPSNYIDNYLSTPTSSEIETYGLSSSDADTSCLILNKADPIIAGDYYFALEHSIYITKKEDSDNLYTAKYILTEKETTNYQEITATNANLTVKTDSSNIKITARAYQYKKTTYVQQIVSSSYLNKVQKFSFEDQFCAATLYYKNASEESRITLRYSDLSSTTTGLSAFYNLTDSNELQIIFKSDSGSFVPAANTYLTINIFTTKAESAPSKFSGDALMLFSKVDLKSLPLVINFNPTSIIGAKNAPSIEDIKQTIINEISTRNTITTQADLNSYFDTLTSLIADINSGKVKFIKQRDDIIKRTYNAYLLLRDGENDSGSASSSASFISACVPTNTINCVTNGSLNPTTNRLYKLDYLKINDSDPDDNGYYDILNGTTKDGYYTCPFYILIYDGTYRKCQYIYNMTDQTSKLSYNDTSSGYIKSTNYYMDPISARLYRGFSAGTAVKADDKYQLTLSFTTNFDFNNVSIGGKISLDFNTSATTISGISSANCTFESEPTDSDTYNSTITLYLDVDSNEFNFTNSDDTASYFNGISIQDKIIKSSEAISINLNELNIDGESIDITYKTDTSMTFYQTLDDIMESSFILDNDNNIIGLSAVPVVHSSYFNSSAGNGEEKKEKFVSQLFTYINLLKENLDRLETSTFFSMKFYKTYGTSNFYNTSDVNINLEFDISLNTSYTNNEQLQNEIRSYIRRLVDQMNSSGDGVRISVITAALSQATTYGQYIDHIDYIGLNDTFVQYINKIDGVSEIGKTPEWINIQPSNLTNIKFS